MSAHKRVEPKQQLPPRRVHQHTTGEWGRTYHQPQPPQLLVTRCPYTSPTCSRLGAVVHLARLTPHTGTRATRPTRPARSRSPPAENLSCTPSRRSGRTGCARKPHSWGRGTQRSGADPPGCSGSPACTRCGTPHSVHRSCTDHTPRSRSSRTLPLSTRLRTTACDSTGTHQGCSSTPAVCPQSSCSSTEGCTQSSTASPDQDLHTPMHSSATP